MKKLLLILLVVVVLSLTGCIAKPHEECIDEWEHKMQTKQIVIISYTNYILETEYGDVTVSKKIYEQSMLGEYKEVCIMVQEGEVSTLIGATLKDGTALDQNFIDEIVDQVMPEEEPEEEVE